MALTVKQTLLASEIAIMIRTMNHSGKQIGEYNCKYQLATFDERPWANLNQSSCGKPVNILEIECQLKYLENLKTGILSKSKQHVEESYF